MTSAPSRTPTARELVAARQASPKPSPVPATPIPTATAVASYNGDYRSRYLDEVAPSGIAGRLVKFKDGEYLTSDDDKPLPPDDEYILLADDTLVGWIKFNGTGEAPDKVMGLLFDGWEMPPRESLGDTDQSKWELGLDGTPADPWQHHQYLVLQQTDTQELFTFVTSSRTGRRAVGNLLRHFDRMRRHHPDELPVVRLAKGGFKHRDDRIGWVNVPLFVVVGRAPRDSATKPDTSIAAVLNDEIPHL